MLEWISGLLFEIALNFSWVTCVFLLGVVLIGLAFTIASPAGFIATLAAGVLLLGFTAFKVYRSGFTND